SRAWCSGGRNAGTHAWVHQKNGCHHSTYAYGECGTNCRLLNPCGSPDTDKQGRERDTCQVMSCPSYDLFTAHWGRPRDGVMAKTPACHVSDPAADQRIAWGCDTEQRFAGQPPQVHDCSSADSDVKKA